MKIYRIITAENESKSTQHLQQLPLQPPIHICTSRNLHTRSIFKHRNHTHSQPSAKLYTLSLLPHKYHSPNLHTRLHILLHTHLLRIHRLPHLHRLLHLHLLHHIRLPHPRHRTRPLLRNPQTHVPIPQTCVSSCVHRSVTPSEHLLLRLDTPPSLICSCLFLRCRRDCCQMGHPLLGLTVLRFLPLYSCTALVCVFVSQMHSKRSPQIITRGLFRSQLPIVVQTISHSSSALRIAVLRARPRSNRNSAKCPIVYGPITKQPVSIAHYLLPNYVCPTLYKCVLQCAPRLPTPPSTTVDPQLHVNATSHLTKTHARLTPFAQSPCLPHASTRSPPTRLPARPIANVFRVYPHLPYIRGRHTQA